ncbi:hypothetical protein M9H77_33362 [Catharanthus roseus]|uniref:Uncharacterized protein n=1 Tax=Catharanthus roseus TaxID=4058 RepID=A0ACB9ZMB8_CATRO|nr:hypothetical protein M9H77_33362 [Catharanthus roseus]
MASMASPCIHRYSHHANYSLMKSVSISPSSSSSSCCILAQQQQPQKKTADQPQPGRREIILRSSEIAVLGAIFHFSGKKPNYLGVQKNPPALALCPATNNCVSTSENTSDPIHYAPPWNYNPKEGRGSKKPVSREEAMQELLDVIKSTKPDNFAPRIVEQRDDYIRVEYESPIFGFVDDVEFWFPPGNKPLVQYRSASRLGNFDFDANRKRVKALRLKLEKKGWTSENSL